MIIRIHSIHADGAAITDGVTSVGVGSLDITGAKIFINNSYYLELVETGGTTGGPAVVIGIQTKGTSEKEMKKRLAWIEERIKDLTEKKIRTRKGILSDGTVIDGKFEVTDINRVKAKTWDEEKGEWVEEEVGITWAERRIK
jgi:hypothetical protein